MEITTQIIGLIASLGILVFIHELGHFVFARLFKTRVEKFYLFFNIGFSIVRMKKVNGKKEFSFSLKMRLNRGKKTLKQQNGESDGSLWEVTALLPGWWMRPNRQTSYRKNPNPGNSDLKNHGNAS